MKGSRQSEFQKINPSELNKLKGTDLNLVTVPIFFLHMDPLHEWRLNFSGNTYTSYATRSCKNPLSGNIRTSLRIYKSIVIQSLVLFMQWVYVVNEMDVTIDPF